MDKELILLIVSIVVPLASAAATLIPVLTATFNNRKSVLEKLNLVVRDMARLTMHDEHLPLEERITAGDRYIDNGGNGASKVYHGKLVDEYKKQLDLKDETK